ncbi:MAG: type VI secretion system baseplate subunit TssF [Planctomycetota bacterium]|nr:type VI secretion system baseplate subunit TssF [Planctomycetota bacterium]
MDKRLIRYYESELRHLRTVANEFAREHPKIAERLAIEEFKCPDPYVERLLEGFAFLAARVQLKIDSEFPRFTQNLLETAYPHYLAPTPSMAVVQLNPDFAEASLAGGYVVPRQTILRSLLGRGEQTSCEYRTAHEIKLWPISVDDARYYTRDLPMLELDRGTPVAGSMTLPSGAKAGLRLTLKSPAALPFSKIKLDALDVYLHGGEGVPGRLYETLLAHASAVVLRAGYPPGTPPGKMNRWCVVLDPSTIRRVGYSRNEALMPYDARSFQGYRLLHEYFAFPQRFQFLAFTELAQAAARCDQNQLEIVILFDRERQGLEGAVTKANFRLCCTPAINLFPKRADRIFVSDRANEFQVIPDRAKPLDFEVYRVASVTGFESGTAIERPFAPFYSAKDSAMGASVDDAAFYAVHRVPRALSEREQRFGRRSSYAGSEVYVSLVDAAATPFSANLRQLAVETLCTNRDLPLQMAVGKGSTDFTLEIGAPVTSVRVVGTPTPPRPSHAEGEMSWRLISHLGLNYLSLIDEDDRNGAAGLRDIMRLYADAGEGTIRKQIDGVRSVTSAPVVRRAPSPGPITYVRGLEVTVTLDEEGFEGTGVFLLGSVLDHFFARYASLNTFTETVVRTNDGEVIRWPARLGQRPIF